MWQFTKNMDGWTVYRNITVKLKKSQNFRRVVYILALFITKKKRVN